MEPSRGAAPVYDDEALQGVGTFLTEHHQYMAVQTMEKIAGMQKQLVASFEAQGRARDEAHAREVADLREANESLKHQLDLLRHSMGGLVRDSESASWTAAQRHLAGKKALNKQNIFLSWVRVAATDKADRLLTHLAVALCKRNVKAKCLGAWHRYVHGSHSARAQARAEQKLKNVTSEIVGRYESELDKLRARVTLLQDEVVDGRRRRKILEDELRRTLLKGMVTMNMEALSIFSSAAATDETIARDVGVNLLYDAEPPLPRAAPPAPAPVEARL